MLPPRIGDGCLDDAGFERMPHQVGANAAKRVHHITRLTAALNHELNERETLLTNGRLSEIAKEKLAAATPTQLKGCQRILKLNFSRNIHHFSDRLNTIFAGLTANLLCIHLLQRLS